MNRKCPSELSTVVASKVAARMSTETSNSNDNNNNLNLLNCNETTTSNTSATDPDRSNIDLATIDTFGPDKFPSQNGKSFYELILQTRKNNFKTKETFQDFFPLRHYVGINLVLI